MEHWFDVVIVGADPAGCAAALQLAKRNPEFAARILLLADPDFPRNERCRGGLIPHTDRLLEHLESPTDAPALTVGSVFFHPVGGSPKSETSQFFRTVDREAFDASLLRHVRKKGIPVRECEPVSSLTREGEWIRVETPCGSYRGRVVIGADGARSRIRRELVGPARGEPFVALEASMPDPAASDEASFDFRLIAQGLRGYAWDFPCFVRGERRANRGIGGIRWPPCVSLRDLFAIVVRERGFRLEGARLAGWSAPLYHPDSPQGAAGVLLAGDAAGVAPWLGDRIPMALGTGILAADAVADGFAEGRLDFSNHAERVRESALRGQRARSSAVEERFCDAVVRAANLADRFAEVR